MNYMTRKVSHVIILCMVCASGVGLAGCVRESHENIVIMAVGLQSVERYWIDHGRPRDFDPSTVVRSSCEHYYVFTNTIPVAGALYHCRFAARSSLVHAKGAVTITDEGILLWIADKDGRVVVSPEKNGLPR